MSRMRKVQSAEQLDAAKLHAIDVALEEAERCRASGRYEEGIRVLEDVVKTSADCAMIYFRLGNLLIDQGDLGRAEHAYLRALDLDPQHAASTNNLAIIYKRTGRMALYIKTYKRAQRLELRATLRRGSWRHVQGDRSSPRRWGTLILVVLAVAAICVVIVVLR
jgi:tetratricopeptide (TPR) repeat protein